MVFYQIGAGLCFGVMLPQFVDHNVYMVIANSFMRPHLRFRVYLANKNPNMALDSNMIGSYVKDVFGSTLLFFMVILPTLKSAYFPSKVIESEQEGDDSVYNI